MIGVIATLWALGGCKADDADPAPPQADTATIASERPITCANPGARSAERFEHKKAITQKLPAANQTSGGLATGDIDGDGLLDLIVVHELGSQVWMNAGEGAWLEVSDAFDGIDLANGVGAVLVDYDGDDDLDLTITRWERPNALLQNDGTGHFTDVTASSGWGAYNWRTQSSSWADVDLDGDLDVYFGAYGPKPATYTSAHPPADPSEFYLNNGDGTFTEHSDWIPEDLHDGYAFSSAFYDVDGDFYPELFQFNDFGATSPERRSRMLHNDGGKGFESVTDNGIDRDFEDMGVGVGDVNGDLLPDFVMTSWQKVNLLTTYSQGWVLNGQDILDIDYVNRNQVYGWGADFGDVDNDRDLDLVMTFGYWSVYDGKADPLVQVDGLWIQDDDGRFENLAAESDWGVNDKGIGRGVLFADVNDDGYLDILKRELDDTSPTVQHLSHCGDDAFLRVELRQPGMNTRAIGATVDFLSDDGLVQRRWIQAGSASLYVGHPPEAHAGLGDEATVGIRVTWPDGVQSEFTDVETRQHLVIERM